MTWSCSILTLQVDVVHSYDVLDRPMSSTTGNIRFPMASMFCVV